MSSQPKSGGNSKAIFAGIVIPAAIVIAFIVFKTILGNPSNFMENNPENLPLPGNYLGTIYKGGFIVPILIALLMIVITFSIERFITINSSKGKGSVARCSIVAGGDGQPEHRSLPRPRRVTRRRNFDGIAGREMVEKALHGHPSSCKNGFTAQHFRILRNDIAHAGILAVKAASLQK